ncbi:MAG: hypothetical protein IJ901_11915 [Bacteroidaceae bacterium]|nr:hypothetical protein [Bacteroidaceae bacterium]
MKFRILLENRKNGEEAVIEMPANASLESISSKIKVAFRLPYADYAWHRYILRGATYVPEEHIIAEEEIVWESGLRPGIYRCSDDIPLSRAFTTLGSAFLYMQDESFWGDYQVRCTLLERVE